MNSIETKRFGMVSWGIVVASGLLAVACGKKSTDGASVGVNISALSAAVAEYDGARDRLLDQFGLAGPGILALGDSASSTAAQLESLKYLFGQMEICQDLSVNGSAFNGGTGCISLYDWGKGGGPETVTASTFASYADAAIDLASSTSTAAFNAKAGGTITAGSYNYVTVNWSPYISVKGAVGVSGATLRTQTCSADATTGLCKTTAALNTGTTNGESLVKSANGGSWFKFQSPFVITDADVTAKTAFQIDMVFNPAGAIAGSQSTTPTSGFQTGFVCDVDSGTTGNCIYVPMIQLTPMPKKKGEVTSRETYTIALPSSTGTTRVELYYGKSDTAKTVYGVNVLTLLKTTDSGSYGQIDNGSKIATMSTASDGSLTLKFTDGSSVITGLKRATSTTAANTAMGNVTINWLGGNSGTGNASAAYTYVGTTDL